MNANSKMSEVNKNLKVLKKKRSLADIDLNKLPVKTDNINLTLDDLLVDARKLLILFFNNDFEKSIEGIQLYSEASIIHSIAMCGIRFLQMLLTMSKAQMNETVDAVKKSLIKIESKRYLKSYKSWLMNPNYNDYTDLQCFAEICFVLANLNYGILIALRDQSIFGVINAGYKINSAYRTLNECSLIIKNKTNWSSQESKLQFESFSYLAQGTLEIFLSLFPAKLIKLFEYMGFASNQTHALELLKLSMQKPENLSYTISSLILALFYGLCNYFYGLGDKNVTYLVQISNEWKKNCPKGAFTILLLAMVEVNKSNFDLAINYLHESIECQSYWIQLHFCAYICLAFCCSIKKDWKNAEKCIRILRDKCKWSSALFYYFHSVVIWMQTQNQNEKEKEISTNLIKHQLKLIPSLKRKLGGIHVFHEELSLTRSKYYLKNLDKLRLPMLEIYYYWNLFYLMNGDSNLLEDLLNDIQIEIDNLEKNDNLKESDLYMYLIFHKAVILRHLNKIEEAELMFSKVLESKSKLTFYFQLVPLTYFELAKILLDEGKWKEGKKMLSKVKNYSNYFGESLIDYRIGLIHEKHKNDKRN